MNLIEMFKLLVEVCGFGRTVVTILSVVAFYIITIITLILIFKLMIKSLRELITEGGCEE